MPAYYFNDLSLGHRLHEKADVLKAMEQLVQFHTHIRKLGHVSYLHKGAIYRCTVGGEIFAKGVQRCCSRDVVRRITALIDKSCPALPEDALAPHGLLCTYSGQNISDTALAECAYRSYMGEEYGTVYSLIDSNFCLPQLKVCFQSGLQGHGDTVDVDNLWTFLQLQEHLGAACKGLDSWDDLIQQVEGFCTQVKITQEAVERLRVEPFAHNVAEQVFRRLEALQLLSKAEDERTFQQLHAKFCQGDKAWFSPSSDAECRNFKEEMSFDVDRKKVFCPYHGKVKIQQYRIHMVGTPQKGQEVVVTYIGPKITKQ